MFNVSDMQSPETVRLSQVARPGGAANVGAGDLARVLAGVAFPVSPRLLAGLHNGDDAGVYQIGRDVALVQSADVVGPIVDDPFEFGRIAATHAFGNIYAMGGTPVTALNIAAFPIDTLDDGILSRILAGGAAAAEAAGVVILGGHTVKDDAPAYGMAVTGTIHPDRIVTNAGARMGDHLLLTKPLGAGILTTARRRDGIPASDLVAALAEMTRLNAAARDVMLAHAVHAATDIGVYGLLGHAVGLARASHVGIEIESVSVPLFARVLELIDLDFVPNDTEANLVHHDEFTSYADYVSGAIRVALSDAMTSGGLLIAATPNDIRAMHKALAPTHTCAIIGRVTEDGDGTISVS
jgi:selenide,water dikinase